jgi:APA family basic amino acid/polyamine antiporter
MKTAPAVAKSETAPKGRLLHILGVGFGIAVIIGGTIGVGILRLPGAVAAQLGDFWLIMAVWALGGVYSLCGSMAVTELGVMLPRAGGFYVYARRAFGDYVGFNVGWSDWLSSCASLAAAAITVGEYAAALVPPLAGGSKVIALVIILVFSLLHWRGLRVGSLAQQLTSLLTALAFLALVAACFILGGKEASASSEQAGLKLPASPAAMFVAVVMALRSVLVTYDGWYGAIYFAEENRDPARNLPRSMIGGVVCVTGIYLLVNLALLYALTIPQLAASQLPAADAAQAIFGARGGRLITALSLLTLLSLINSVLLCATRIIFALSRDRLFSAQAAAVNAAGTPVPAMLMSALAATLLVASGTFEKVIAVAAIFFVANYSVCFLSLLVLRKREPELPRPFRAWGYPWTTLIVLVGSLAFLVGAIASDTTNSVYALALLACAYPVYVLVRRWSLHRDLTDTV